MQNWKQSITQRICNFRTDCVAYQAVSRRILITCFQAVHVEFTTAGQVIPQARLFFLLSFSAPTLSYIHWSLKEWKMGPSEAAVLHVT